MNPRLWLLRINFLESGTAWEGLIKITTTKHQFQRQQTHPSEAKLRGIEQLSTLRWSLVCRAPEGGLWPQVPGSHGFTELGRAQVFQQRVCGASVECYTWDEMPMVGRLECDFGLLIVLTSPTWNCILIHLHSILNIISDLYLWAFFT